MEPLPLRTMLNIIDVALSDSSSEEQDAPSVADFEELCPIDYCSRTEMSLSFMYSPSGSPLDAPRRLDMELAALLRDCHEDIFGVVCSDFDDQLQRYVLSDDLLRHGAGAKDARQCSTVAHATESSSMYNRIDLISVLDTLRDSLTFYASVSGNALYARPYSGLLDDVFNASQLPMNSVRNYIRTKKQTYPTAISAILADVCAYRRGFLSCYQHLSEAPFSVILGSNFEALLWSRESSNEHFCMVSGYPGLLEALEQTLKRHPEPCAFTFKREGSSIYVSGDLTAVAGFLLYKISLNVGLNATEKSLPQIYCPVLFECSYKAAHLLHKVADDAGRLTIRGYLPSFIVRLVIVKIQMAMQSLSEKHLIVIELSPPTQHTRHFNSLEPSTIITRTASASKINQSASQGRDQLPHPPEGTARCIALSTRGFMLCL